MAAGGTQASVNQSFRWRSIPDRPDDMVGEQLEAIMDRDLAGAISSGEKINEELRADLEEPRTVSHRMKLEGDMKRRGSRGLTRFLIAICLGIAGTLAWQSYGEVTKQIIATRAPELGWSPGAKQMIASSIEWLGWTKSPNLENTAPQTVAPKGTATSVDPAQVQQMVQNLAALREMVQELTAGQDQTTREIAKLESAVVEILMKMPEPPQPPAAPARKPAPAPPPSSRAPTAQPPLRPSQ
jgi:cell division protein FtsB